MRVMHITETMVSGVLRYLKEITLLGEKEGFEQFILFSAKREFTPSNINLLLTDNVEFINVNIHLGGGFWNSLKEVYRCIKTIRPDIIHVHSSIAGLVVRCVSVIFPRIRVFYTPHGYSFLQSHKSIWKRACYWLAEFFLTQIKGKIIACSLSEYKYARILSLWKRPLLLENAIPPSDVSFEFNARHLKVVGAGRLEEQKNPFMFIDIVSRLQRKYPGVEAAWVGDGSLRKACEDRCRETGAVVHFTGWLTNEQTLEIFRQSSVFLQTSRWEGLPFTVLEAMSIGLTVIATDIPSHQDLFANNYSGYIANSVEEFLDSFDEINNHPEVVHSMMLQNHKRLRSNYERFGENLKSIYSNEKLRNS